MTGAPPTGNLPKGWTVAAVGDFADVALGKMLDKGKAVRGVFYPYLRNINVRWGSVDTSDLLEMPFGDEELERYSVRPGDLLVCEGGEPGRAAVWRRDELDLKYQKALHRIRPDGGVLPEWLMYHLMLDASQGGLTRHFTGSTIKHFTRTAILEYQLRLAPVSEQARIVEALDSYLSRLDAAVASLERVQAKLRLYRASVLKAAVEGRLVPTEAELARQEQRDYEPASVLLERILMERRRRWEEAELARLQKAGKAPRDDKWKAKYKEPVAPDTSGLPELPEGWCWASLDGLLITDLMNGKSVPDGSDFPVLRLTCVQAGTIILSERKLGNWRGVDPQAFLIRQSDFLIVRGNGSIGLVGRGGLVSLDPDEVAFPDTLIRARLSPSALESLLLPHWWDSPVVRQYIERKARTTAGIYKVNQDDLRATPIPLPPRTEQSRILEEVERLDSIGMASARLLGSSLDRTRRLRQGVLKWAFEGKLVDQDPADEPAENLLERIRAERAAAADAAPSRQRRRRSEMRATVGEG